MSAALDIEPVEWVYLSERRVCRKVGRLFEQAFDKARRENAMMADQRRRAIAQMQDTQFPHGWGEPLAKYWIVPGADGGQCATPIPPISGKSLTVWRWTGFEATATFDLWQLDIDSAAGGWGLRFRKNPPPMGDWQDAGPTDNHSTLWRRALKGGAQ